MRTIKAGAKCCHSGAAGALQPNAAQVTVLESCFYGLHWQVAPSQQLYLDKHTGCTCRCGLWGWMQPSSVSWPDLRAGICTCTPLANQTVMAKLLRGVRVRQRCLMPVHRYAQACRLLTEL